MPKKINSSQVGLIVVEKPFNHKTGEKYFTVKVGRATDLKKRYNITGEGEYREFFIASQRIVQGLNDNVFRLGQHIGLCTLDYNSKKEFQWMRFQPFGARGRPVVDYLQNYGLGSKVSAAIIASLRKQYPGHKIVGGDLVDMEHGMGGMLFRLGLPTPHDLEHTKGVDINDYYKRHVEYFREAYHRFSKRKKGMVPNSNIRKWIPDKIRKETQKRIRAK